MSTRSSSIHEDGLYTNLSEVHSLHRHSHHPSSYPYDDDTNNYLVVSDNQTDISSDLIATTKYLEKQFQQRYNILKIAYEDRIKQLSSTLEETCHEIVSNEIIDSLKQDPTSSMFIPNFIQDILFSHLKSERENYILEILNHEAELKYLLQTEKDLCHQQNETILSLKQEIQQNKEADEVISSMKEQIKTLKERYQQLFEQNKEELTTAVKLKEAAELKETSLREQLRFISDNLQEKTHELDKVRVELEHKTKEVFELEKKSELNGKDIIFKEASESRYRNELDRLNQQYQLIFEQKETLQRDFIKLQETNRSLSYEVDKLRQSEVTLIQENKKCQQSVTEIIKKVEKMLEEEANEHEAALETYKRKMSNMKEKYESDLLTLNTHLQQKDNEIKILKQQYDERNKEIKSCRQEINNLKEDYAYEYEKQVNMRKRIEELISDSTKYKLESNEYQNKIRKLEQQQGELISQHNREIMILREEMRLANQQRIEKERNLLDRKSDTYRLKYDNNFQEYLQSRHHSYPYVSQSERSFQVPPPPPPPPPPAPDTSIEFQTQNESFLSQIQREYENQIKILKDNLSKAEISIERLHKMVLEGKESVTHYKSIAEDLKYQLKIMNQKLLSKSREENTTSSSTIHENNRMESHNSNYHDTPNTLIPSSTTPTGSQLQQLETTSLLKENKRIQELENDLEQVKNQLLECQQQALHDQEEDSKLLHEMQRKFDILMDKYEATTQEKIDEIQKLINENKILHEQFNEMKEKNHSLENLIQGQDMEKKNFEKNEIENFQKEQKYLLIIENLNKEILEKNSNLENMEKNSKKQMEEYFNHLEQQTLLLQTRANEKEIFMNEINLLKNQIKNNKIFIKNEKLKFKKIFETYENELQFLRRLLLKLKSNVLLLQSSMESEFDILSNEWGYITKRYHERVNQEIEEKYRQQLVSINEIQMERELYLMKQSNTATATTTASSSSSRNNIPLLGVGTSTSSSAKGGGGPTPTPPPSVTATTSVSSENINGLSFHTIDTLCDGYNSIIIHILEILQSSSILSDGVCRDIRYLLASLPPQITLSLKQHLVNPSIIPHPTIETLGFSLISAKFLDIFSRGIKSFLNEKQSLSEQVVLLSNDLRKEKVRKDELQMELHKLKEIQHDMSRISTTSASKGEYSIHHLDDTTTSSRWNTPPLASSTTTLENDEKQYYILQINHLNQQIHELQVQYKHDVERIKMEASMKENLLQEKIESLTRVSHQRNEDLIQEIETKLKTEQTRRQHLQTRLLAEESTHRKEIEEIEKRCHEFQIRAERAELEISKLRIANR